MTPEQTVAAVIERLVPTVCTEHERLCGHREAFTCPAVFERATRATSYRYQCTRIRGHKGPHVTCGSITHNLATWSKE